MTNTRLEFLMKYKAQPKILPKQVTHWGSKDTMMPTQYGTISHVAWCQLEAKRMNSASALGLRNYVAEIDGQCCISRSEPHVIESKGAKVLL